MSKEFLTPPKPAPALNIPESDKTVKLSVIDSTSYVDLPIEAFLTPVYKGKDRLTGPTWSFLIEHSSGKKVLFDLGIRKDTENLAPVLRKAIESKGWTVTAEKNTADILEENGVDVKGGAIDAVIWSHHHWDHVGDLAGTFPGSTQLVIGPGFKKAHLPGYPTNKDSPLQQKDFENRDVREIDIATEGKGLKLGRFDAYDYFGDGSFYLASTPGHAIGHICGLARTTASPPSFVFMGGDACHHGAEFRPSEYLPLPTEINPSPIPHIKSPCPGHLLQEMDYEKKANTPFVNVTKSFADDTEKCHWTIAGLQEFDVSEEVLLLCAHDESVKGLIDTYPKTMNDWREKNLGKRVKWEFLGDFKDAVGEADTSAVWRDEAK